MLRSLERRLPSFATAAFGMGAHSMVLARSTTGRFWDAKISTNIQRDRRLRAYGERAGRSSEFGSMGM